jgi:hypothetical protein
VGRLVLSGSIDLARFARGYRLQATGSGSEAQIDPDLNAFHFRSSVSIAVFRVYRKLIHSMRTRGPLPITSSPIFSSRPTRAG